MAETAVLQTAYYITDTEINIINVKVYILFFNTISNWLNVEIDRTEIDRQEHFINLVCID